MKIKHVIIPIFVPHKGCPHDCIFCNQKKISGQIEEMTPEKVTQIIDEHLCTANPDAFVEIAFFGGSFTAIDRKIQKALLDRTIPYLSDGRVAEIRLSTRPDCIDDDILDFLIRYGVRTIELGVQSLDEDVLKASFRGHDASCVYRAAALIKSKGFHLGIQTMTGLPEDTREKCLDTARKVIEMAPDIVRIYPVLVIRGTELERQFRQGTYVPQRIDEAVELCAELLEMYESSGINVIRIGLQTTENICERDGSEVAAGPVHPAIRQLVESKLMLARMEAMIEKQELAGVKELVIITGLSNLSNVIGQKHENIMHLKSKYSIESIKVKGDVKYTREILCTTV
ncbi:MAG: radical SAM protein [Clostridiaceae bacterium]